ncbi:MAG: N-acetylglucosamine-6-phosphate deacetylase [Pyrinomonadaceae bacterium]
MNSSVILKNLNIRSTNDQWPESITISEGRICSFNSDRNRLDEIIDLKEINLFAGFIDVHIHGAVGVDVNTADVDGLLAVAEFLAKNGVTGWVPTLVPDSDENYRRVIGEIDKLMDVQVGRPVAQALGVHYEGVFANEAMCGALRPEFFKKFTGNEIAELPRLKRGVHMTTLAPEIDGGIELVRELVRLGWVVSIGHTKADTQTLDDSCNAGAKHLTHFYNAMTGLHHRDVGVAGWALTRGDVTFDIIADGVHVHPRMLEFACRTKTPDMVSLISDSVVPTGLGDGDYSIWGETVSVVGGKTRNERGSIAGSVITMHDAVKRMLSLGFSAVEVSKMASLNPAKLLGIDGTYGSIEIGKRADLVAVDDAGNIKFVMIGGKVAHEA